MNTATIFISVIIIAAIACILIIAQRFDDNELINDDELDKKDK